jgi:hypothetical protein
MFVRPFPVYLMRVNGKFAGSLTSNLIVAILEWNTYVDLDSPFILLLFAFGITWKGNVVVVVVEKLSSESFNRRLQWIYACILDAIMCSICCLFYQHLCNIYLFSNLVEHLSWYCWKSHLLSPIF